MFDNKVLKKKKLDSEASLRVTQNEMSGRIFVDFFSEDGRLKVQKSFQDTFQGRADAEKFQKKIKSIKDLRKHLGLPEPKPVVIQKVISVELTEQGITTQEKK
jgi:hypothetical protein